MLRSVKLNPKRGNASVCNALIGQLVTAMMNPQSFRFLTVCLLCAGSTAHSQVIVNDTWLDGNRNDPASPTYSEYGADVDLDGDVESAWFRGGAGAFDPVGAGGPLRLTQGSTSSSSLTTYFTPEGSELTLAAPGSSLSLTWRFTVSGTIVANTGQGLRVALVDSPAASRVTGNSSPASAAYTGYGMFINMNPALSHSRPLELMERNVASGNLLSTGGDWVGRGFDGVSGNVGYQAGETYTLTMTLTRTAAGEIDILARMAGGTLNGTGLMSVSYLDATPHGGSFSFDTFQFRPDGNDVAYDIIDTTLFRVELTQVPEPASSALVSVGLLGLIAAYRRARN